MESRGARKGAAKETGKRYTIAPSPRPNRMLQVEDLKQWENGNRIIIRQSTESMGF